MFEGDPQVRAARDPLEEGIDHESDEFHESNSEDLERWRVLFQALFLIRVFRPFRG